MMAVQSTFTSPRLKRALRQISRHWQQAIEPHPSIQDPGTRRQVQLLSAFCIALAILMAAGTISALPLRGIDRLLILQVILVVLFLITYWLSRTRYYQVASILLVSTLSVAGFSTALADYTSLDTGLYAFLPIAFLIAGFLLSTRQTALFVLVNTVAVFLLPLVEPRLAIRDTLRDGGIVMTLGVLIVIFSYMRNLIERDRLTVLNQANDELRNLRDSLEARVEQRTAQLQASAEVGRVVAATLDPDQLLDQVVNLITERFGFYYAAVFTLDDTGTSAMLREASGDAGRILKERAHQLDVNEQSMVGYAIIQRKARIALDVGTDPVRFANPLLPETRSEIALPLIARSHVLGALDVQSTQSAAFDESSAVVLQAMADQVAVALNNAEQFKQIELQAKQQGSLTQFSRSLLAASSAEDLYRVLATQLSNLVPHDYLSLTVAQSGSADLREYPLQAEADLVLTEGHLRSMTSTLSGRAYTTRQPVVSAQLAQETALDDAAQWERTGFQSALCLPLIVGERVLGTLNFASQKPETYSLSVSTQLDQLAGQVAVALENQRLVEAQQTSLRELKVLTRQLSGQAWAKRRQRVAVESARYARSGINSDPLTPAVEIEAAMARGAPVVRSDMGDPNTSLPYQATLAVPIILRGEVLGGLQVSEANQAREWTEDDLTFMQAVADQVALALDNARLIEEAEQRAERERLVADISGRMFAANDLETIVQIAGEELGRALQVKQTTVKVRSELAAELVQPGSRQMTGQHG